MAMSGGVDSSVVAALLKHRGWDVVGITMQIWQESQKDARHSEIGRASCRERV